MLVRINSEESDTRIRFDALAEYYLKADFGEDAVRQKSVNTIPIVEHYVRDYLVARWGNELASDIRPLEIQRWMKVDPKTVQGCCGDIRTTMNLYTQDDRDEKHAAQGAFPSAVGLGVV
jgi:hypothetical protein